MTVRAQGFFESLFLGPETSFKNPPGTPQAYKLPTIGPALNPTINRFKSEALTGSAQPRKPVDGKIELAASFDLEANRLSLGSPLSSLFGSESVQGVSGHVDHIFSLGTLGSWFAEQQFSDVAQYLRGIGSRVTKGSFNFDPEGLCKATFNLMGAKTVLANSAFVSGGGNIVDHTLLDPLRYMTASIVFNGAAIADCTNVKFDVDRQGEAVKAIDGTNEIADIITKIAMVSGSLKAFFTDAVLLNAALNSTECSLQIIVPDQTPGFGWKIEIPTLLFMPKGPVTAGAGGLVTVELSFDAYGTGTNSHLPGFSYSKPFTTVDTSVNDTIIWNIDGGADLTTTFGHSASYPIASVITDINATSGFSAVAVASLENGRILVVSKESAGNTGSSSSVKVKTSGSTAAAALGFPTGVAYAGLSSHAIRMIVSNEKTAVYTTVA